MRGTKLVAALCIAGIAALVAMIVASSLEMSLWQGLKATVDTRWGITTMVDLYAGLAVVAGWIAWRERSVARTALWIVALGLLGNLATLVYLLIACLRSRSASDLFRPVR